MTFGATGTGGTTTLTAIPSTNTTNAAPGNLQINNKAIELSATKSKDAAYIQFGSVNTTGLTNLSLTYITAQSGATQQQTLSYSLTGPTGTFIFVQTQTVPSTFGTIVTFNLPTAVNNQASVYFRITLTPQTQGNDPITADFDNIQLKAMPEPTTVVGGALAVLGLGWHQRRRVLKLRKFLPAAALPRG